MCWYFIPHIDKQMKTLSHIALLFSCFCLSQSTIQNFGNMQMHQDAEVGFHIDLVNNGTFNQNLGLALFYNESNSLSISGSQIPRFFDMEVEVPNHLFLDINTEVENSLSFVSGDVITPRDNPIVSLDFLQNSIFILEDDLRHTDGYASFNGTSTFTFPIGDDDKLRPLITTIASPNTTAKAAYFNEDPNFPSTFPNSFDTTATEQLISSISTIEFWDFDGPNNSIVTLTWDTESDIENLVSDILSLRVVGWHSADDEWKDLGNSGTTGTLNEGTITSVVFNPEDYAVLTFGSLSTSDELTIYNLFSPNNDGTNDTFVIENIENFDNELSIYNRWGNIVFKATNYQNDWDGTSNAGTVFRRDQRLPAGTYYYTIKVPERNIDAAGWLYISY